MWDGGRQGAARSHGLPPDASVGLVPLVRWVVLGCSAAPASSGINRVPREGVTWTPPLSTYGPG